MVLRTRGANRTLTSSSLQAPPAPPRFSVNALQVLAVVGDLTPGRSSVCTGTSGSDAAPTRSSEQEAATKGDRGAWQQFVELLEDEGFTTHALIPSAAAGAGNTMLPVPMLTEGGEDEEPVVVSVAPVGEAWKEVRV